MTDLYDKWIRVVMTAVLLLSGCSTDALREDLPVVEKDPAAPSVYIRLQMGLRGSGIPGGTRADAAGTGETGGTGTSNEEIKTLGTTNENVVRTIDLLVFDAASGELLEYLPLSNEQVQQVVGESSICIPIFVPQGAVVHIHAAVNMTERMRMEFHLGRKIDDIALASARTDYWDVINEFVPGSDGKQQTLENYTGGCIPMTGRFTIVGNDNPDIPITQLHATKETALDIRADVSRIVAKVHVLTEQSAEPLTPAEKAVKEAGVTYARSMSAEANESIGWIRQSDVRYMVNGTNKSTYIFAQPNNKDGEYSKWKDRNMNLESYLMGGIDLGLGFDAPAWAADYVFYNGMSLHRENIAVPNHLAEAEAYDETRYGQTGGDNDGPDRYVRGLYCLENYFDTPTSPSFAKYEDAIPMVTHVSIAAKLTPRWIVILKDYATKMDAFVENYGDKKEEFLADYGLTTEDFTDDDVARWTAIKTTYSEYFTSDAYLYRNSFRIIRTENEKDAADILNWSLKVNHLWSRSPDEFELDKYPDGTFYVYDMKYDSQSVVTNDFEWKQKHLYLSAGAFASATAENIDIKTYSVPHLGGWGYYYTYLDELRQQAVDGKTPFTSSQVTRNTYYLLTVRNFGVPGGSVSRPEYIKVNTEPVGWDYDGRGDLELH